MGGDDDVRASPQCMSSASPGNNEATGIRLHDQESAEMCAVAVSFGSGKIANVRDIQD